ncbi:hypothetical protein WDV76_10890 [Xenorhabdus griffiniae]|uniref:hypothetical protein n=1 Tax=Xenorhabdus griffiniae TaxID=351672 RepID=UPI0030D21FAB
MNESGWATKARQENKALFDTIVSGRECSGAGCICHDCQPIEGLRKSHDSTLHHD